MAETDQSAIEAAAWLVALDAGDADRAAFERWRREPANALAFIRAERTWRDLDLLRTPSVAAPAEAEHKSAPTDAGLSRRALLSAAALLGVAFAGTALVETRAGATIVETAVGERRRFYVDRNTCVDLNTASRLAWRTGSSGSVLTLDRGEMLVTVAAGAPRCRVRAAAHDFDMGNGRFDVRLQAADRVDLVALGGQARLASSSARGNGLVVPAGRRLRLGQGVALEQAMSDGELRSLEAWKRGELLLHGEPLATAIAEYNRYLPEPMVLADDTLGGFRLGGRFLTDDPSQFLDAIRVNFAIRADRRNGTILLSRD